MKSPILYGWDELRICNEPILWIILGLICFLTALGLSTIAALTQTMYHPIETGIIIILGWLMYVEACKTNEKLRQNTNELIEYGDELKKRIDELHKLDKPDTEQQGN